MKAFLIPGSGEDLKSRDYKAVLDMYKEAGYEPVFIPIEWQYKTIDSWVEQALAKVPKTELRGSILSGFSYGSMVALGVAAKINPAKLLLFSLSPYFKEDFPLPEKYAKWAGKRQTENFKLFSMNKLAEKIACPTLIFIGKREIDKYADTDQRSSEAHKRIKDSKLIVIDNVGHDIANPRYVEAIKQVINT